MDEYWLNLFPVELNLSPEGVKVFRLYLPEGKGEIFRRVRFGLSRLLKAPVYFRRTPEGALFYALTREEVGDITLELPDGGVIRLFSSKSGFIQPDDTGLGDLIKDILHFEGVEKNFSLLHMEEVEDETYGGF